MATTKTMFDPGLTERYSGRLNKTINPDGTFNVRREGGRLRDAGWYLHFMNLSWPAFLTVVPVLYLSVNVLFAGVYYAIGVQNLQGADTSTPLNAFLSAFFFSVQTFTTVGYGHIAPNGITASLAAAIEAMTGLMAFALATGLLYGRFSRPSARLMFSRNALVAPFQGGKALMFRLANQRPNILMELEATVLMMTVDRSEDPPRRRYVRLDLERSHIFFLPLAWTVVHPIDEASPLWGKSAADLEHDQVEFLVLVKMFDDTFSQTVHARYSYAPDDVVWDARFQPTFHVDDGGTLVLDLQRLDQFAQ